METDQELTMKLPTNEWWMAYSDNDDGVREYAPWSHAMTEEECRMLVVQRNPIFVNFLMSGKLRCELVKISGRSPIIVPVLSFNGGTDALSGEESQG